MAEKGKSYLSQYDLSVIAILDSRFVASLPLGTLSDKVSQDLAGLRLVIFIISRKLEVREVVRAKFPGVPWACAEVFYSGQINLTYQGCYEDGEKQEQRG